MNNETKAGLKKWIDNWAKDFDEKNKPVKIEHDEDWIYLEKPFGIKSNSEQIIAKRLNKDGTIDFKSATAVYYNCYISDITGGGVKLEQFEPVIRGFKYNL